VFEEGDEILIQDDTIKVPIIVAFTKYDQLVNRMKRLLASSPNMDDVEWANQAKLDAMTAVRETCEKPLNAVAGNRHARTQVSTTPEYKDTIDNLIELTLGSIVSVTK